MARSRRKFTMAEAAVPISAMIDIVFLLIIFFVTTAAMEKEIDDEKVVLANAPHGKPVTKKDPRAVTINVRPDGTTTMGMLPMTMPVISQQLLAAASKWGSDIPIIIRGDHNAQHYYIKQVMDAVTATKLYRVKFNAAIDDGGN